RRSTEQWHAKRCALLPPMAHGINSEDRNAKRRTLNTEPRTLDRTFFESDPVTCAQALIGCELVWGKTAGRIVETEAYAEHGDEASHTFFRRGARRSIQKNRPGQ